MPENWEFAGRSEGETCGIDTDYITSVTGLRDKYAANNLLIIKHLR